ncbi:MAG: c-type cytochrome [Hydrogenovibrio sp.]|nr:c-type cytochrome [Hydrogenovibrio sp.]
MKKRLLMVVACCSSLTLFACSDSSQQADKSAAEAPAMTSETSSGVKPPSEDQTSTMDVKTNQAMEDQAEKPAMTEEESAASDYTSDEAAADTQVANDDTVVEATSKANDGATLYATCAGCHGSNGEGGVGPKLQGQTEDELVSKLMMYKAGKERGPMSAMMIPNAQQLSDEDIKAVSKYIAGF